MPRILLSDAEAAHIEKLRAKNAGVRGWNEAIDFVLAQLELQLNEVPNESGWHPERVRQIKTNLAAAKKPELLT